MHHGQAYKILSDVGQCYCPQLYPNNCSMAPTKIDGILTVVLVTKRGMYCWAAI